MRIDTALPVLTFLPFFPLSVLLFAILPTLPFLRTYRFYRFYHARQFKTLPVWTFPPILFLRPTGFTALRILQFGQFYNISAGWFTIYQSRQFPALSFLTFYHFPCRLYRFPFWRILPFGALASFTILPFASICALPVLTFLPFRATLPALPFCTLHSVSFREFPPHIHLYSIYVSDFVDICRVASGRGRRTNFLARILDKIATPVLITPVCSSRQLPRASATYTFVGFVDICHVARGRVGGVRSSWAKF